MSKWPYNTAAWARARQWVLGAEPLCRYCREIGEITPATEVDHITPLREAPDRALDPENLQPLCKHCHDSVKQQEEATGHRRGASSKGIPLSKAHHWHD